jgi:hypothetical protein
MGKPDDLAWRVDQKITDRLISTTNKSKANDAQYKPICCHDSGVLNYETIVEMELARVFLIICSLRSAH